MFHQQFERSITQALEHILNDARAQAVSLARTLANDRTNTPSLTRAFDFDIMRVRAQDLARYRALEAKCHSARDHFHAPHALDLDRVLARTPAFEVYLRRTLASKHPHGYIQARKRALDHAIDVVLSAINTSEFDNILELYIAIFILQERITGNIPAYEGILLMKDRSRRG